MRWMLLLALALQPAKDRSAPAPRDRGDAYYHFSLGQQARLSGDVGEALQHYRRAQKADPGSGAIRAEMARALREAGRLDEALTEAREAVRLENDSVEAHLILAQLNLALAEGEAGEPDQALKNAAAEYEAVSRLQPTDVQTLLTLANLYRRLEQHKDAVRVLQQYLTLDPGSFEAQVRVGDHFLAQGDSESAAAAFKKALELQPSSAQAYEKLGESYARAQQADQAILHYRKALEIEPRSLRVRLALGEVLVRARRPKEALGEAEAVLANDSANRLALDLKGRCLRELKEFDRAAETADLVLAQDRNDLKALYLKVTIAEARRDFATAVTGLETLLARKSVNEDATERGSNDRVFLIHLGFAYQQLDRFTDAASAFARAKDIGGEPDAALLGYHVEALLLAKNLDAALVAARAARAKFADDPDLATQEATILRSRGDLPGALDIIEKLERRSPKDAAVLVQIAEFYQKAKRFGDAEAVLRRARDIKPKELSILFQLGAVLERQKRHDAAEAVFREALAVKPDSAPVLNYLGYMNADRGVRLDEAAGLIEKALSIDPENGAYLDSLGWAFFRLNRLEQAEETLRKAVAKQSDNGVVFDHLGDVLKRRGSIVEAMDCWRKALQGGDEGEELDRTVVERKINDAQASLDRHQPPRP